ncbi:hypothetical protein VPH35_085093 [Triticum aestivum]
MSFSSAALWWEEWQLRVLVIGSLFIQFLLYFSDMVRRSPTLGKFRMFVWVAYIGGDAVAIYALATLFNRYKQQTVGGESSALEVVWAPVLLIHLGGQPWITAYSLEDNEMWKRHAMTLVSQVTAALYVFCKWWSGEKRLLQVAVLLFIVGILKFSQKPWALKRASFNSMVASASSRQARCLWWDTCCYSARDIRFPDNWSQFQAASEDDDHSLNQYVALASNCPPSQILSPATTPTRLNYIYLVFVDISAAYTCRLDMRAAYLSLDNKDAYSLLQCDIRFIFQLLYTKLGTATSLAGILPLILLPFLILASLALFAMSHKDDYDDQDIRVTYILLCCTALQELLLTLSFLCAPCRKAYSGAWHNMVSQYNLMSFCARKKQPTILMKLAIFDCLRDYLNKNWYIGQEPAAERITELVRKHVKDGWKNYIRCDAARYRRFNDFRGQRALRRHRRLLGWSLRKTFDESIVLWHIATDLCFHDPNSPPQGQGDVNRSGTAREILNYMMYLLSTHPEMLMPGTRPVLFTAAISSIERILMDTQEPLHSEENIARSIVSMVAEQPSTWYNPSLIDNACSIARALMELEDSERWKVIQGVWVEMLCYSASKCRGYLHAKSLGEGGEYLTTVWLHWSLMGMETLADRLQRPEPLLEDDEEVQEQEGREIGVVEEEDDDEEENGRSLSSSQSIVGGDQSGAVRLVVVNMLRMWRCFFGV